MRFRHTDTDLVREARQQDFIRWAKSQYSIGTLVSNRDHLLKILGQHSQSDEGLHSIDGLLKLFDLAANMESNHATIKQIPFPATLQPCTPTECYVTSTPGQQQATWAQFIHATPAGSSEPRPAKARHKRRRGQHAPSTAGLIDDVTDGRAQAQALSRAGMPVYFPRLVMPSASSANPYCSGLQANCNDGDEPATVYTHAYPRQYEIDGPDGKRYRAYRMTLTTNYQLDTFYGVQGTTWNDPPLLSSPSGTRTVNGRKLFLYKDGSKLTTVAWHHDGDAYWISNTLTEDLTNSQMVSIAASLMQ